jgi:CRP/FNR family cyclic AMP-dependent transcriptional regulator
MAVPAESLAATQLLRELEPPVAAAIGAAATEREWPAEALVLQHDDPSTDVFFVLRGGVRVTVLAWGGREIIFSDLGVGEQFGELAAIDQGPRSASVTTLYPTRLLVLPAAAFRAALAASPIMAGRMIAQMAARIRSLSARFVEVALGSVRHRLVAALLREARPRPGSPERIVSPPPRHHVLAARIGVRREAVTRELAALERLGLLRQEARGIVLLRPLQLADLHAEAGGRD